MGAAAMHPTVRQLVEALHESPSKCALVVTGGGTGAIAALLAVPGGSRTVLEAHVPYNQQATVDYLGFLPDNYCSVPAARALAICAYERAGWLDPEADVVGIGCTASLATDRPKRGEHHVHIGMRNARRQAVWSLTLQKGARSRAQEDDVVSLVLLNALADGFDIPGRVDIPLLPGEHIEQETPPGDVLSRFLTGELHAIRMAPDGQAKIDLPAQSVLLPGAFNPLHEGHRGLASVAERRLGRPVLFELSVQNVDKPPLTAAEIRRRAHQFAWHTDLVLTRAPAFVEKAMLFPGATFAIGADTAVRIVSPRYYGDSETAMTEALAQIQEKACRFLVACRVDEQGHILRLSDAAIPSNWVNLFEEIAPEDFLMPVSSTQIRQGTL